MKPKNYPARKLQRQMEAQIRSGALQFLDADALIEARRVRTKKYRGA